MITVARAVNFGAANGGLSTVGFTLKNADGTTNRTRTTSGVSEIVTGKGVYAASIQFDEGWSGYLIWDTGAVTPVYAVENYDYRSYSGGSLVYTGGGGGPVVNYKPEFERLAKLIKRVLDAVQALPDVQESVKSGTERLNERLKELHSDQKLLIESASAQKEVDFTALNQGITQLGEALEALLEAQEFEQTIQEIQHVEIPQ